MSAWSHISESPSSLILQARHASLCQQLDYMWHQVHLTNLLNDRLIRISTWWDYFSDPYYSYELMYFVRWENSLCHELKLFWNEFPSAHFVVNSLGNLSSIDLLVWQFALAWIKSYEVVQRAVLDLHSALALLLPSRMSEMILWCILSWQVLVPDHRLFL